MKKQTTKTHENGNGLSADVMCSTWRPTMILRWLESRNYIPQLDQFERTLQQKWINNIGTEEWRDIDVYS